MDLSEVTSNANRHPWEMSRADFLLSVIERHAHLGAHAQLLDVGAGDLFFSEKIHGETGVRIDAVDSAFDEEGPRNEAILKIKHLSSVLHKKYDAVCALDVLEHVENDREFLNLLLDMLKPGASVLITVPAFQFLFSEHDNHLRHFRRYRTSQIKRLINDSGSFVMKERFYFFHTLFYFRLFEKLRQKFSAKETITQSKKPINTPQKFKSINQWGFAEHHPITRSLGGVLGLDALFCRWLAKLGIRIPGLSLCVVIRRKK